MLSRLQHFILWYMVWMFWGSNLGHSSQTIFKLHSLMTWKTPVLKCCMILRPVCKIVNSSYKLGRACPSLCTEQLGSHWMQFHDIWLRIFPKSIEKFQVWLTSMKKLLYMMKSCIFMVTSHWILYRMKYVLDIVLEKVKRHILCSVTFFRTSCLLWNNVEKYGGAREAVEDE